VNVSGPFNIYEVAKYDYCVNLQVHSVKLIRDKLTGQLQGYGFVEFVSHAAAERVLTTFNGQMMPNVEMQYRLNWASAGEKRDDSPDYTIFVGDLAADVTDYMLQETFRVHYPSVKGAKVVTDKMTMRPKGYGFVKFGDPTEQARAMTEMNGMPCSSRPMRIGPAANKKTTGVQERGKCYPSHVPAVAFLL
jgi:RNA recognition motif-containing protein